MRDDSKMNYRNIYKYYTILCFFVNIRKVFYFDFGIFDKKHTFFSEKGLPKNFTPTTSLYFGEAFEVARNFSRPTFLERKGRQKNFAPTTSLYFGEAFEGARNFSRPTLIERKGRQKNFTPTTSLYFGEAFEDSQETFLEKFLVSGLGADAPTYNAQKKARQRRAF